MKARSEVAWLGGALKRLRLQLAEGYVALQAKHDADPADPSSEQDAEHLARILSLTPYTNLQRLAQALAHAQAPAASEQRLSPHYAQALMLMIERLRSLRAPPMNDALLNRASNRLAWLNQHSIQADTDATIALEIDQAALAAFDTPLERIALDPKQLSAFLEEPEAESAKAIIQSMAALADWPAPFSQIFELYRMLLMAYRDPNATPIARHALMGLGEDIERLWQQPPSQSAEALQQTRLPILISALRDLEIETSAEAKALRLPLTPRVDVAATHAALREAFVAVHEVLKRAIEAGDWRAVDQHLALMARSAALVELDPLRAELEALKLRAQKKPQDPTELYAEALSLPRLWAALYADEDKQEMGYYWLNTGLSLPLPNEQAHAVFLSVQKACADALAQAANWLEQAFETQQSEALHQAAQHIDQTAKVLSFLGGRLISRSMADLATDLLQNPLSNANKAPWLEALVLAQLLVDGLGDQRAVEHWSIALRRLVRKTPSRPAVSPPAASTDAATDAATALTAPMEATSLEGADAETTVDEDVDDADVDRLMAVIDQIYAALDAPTGDSALRQAMQSLQSLSQDLGLALLDPLCTAMLQHLDAAFAKDAAPAKQAAWLEALSMVPECLNASEDGLDNAALMLERDATIERLQAEDLAPPQKPEAAATPPPSAANPEGTAPSSPPSPAPSPPQAPLEAPAQSDAAINQTFVHEAAGYLSAIQSMLDEGLNTKNRAQILRLLHTFKGAAGAVGISALQKLAHEFEHRIESAPLPLGDEASSLMLEFSEALAFNLEQYHRGQALADFDWLMSEDLEQTQVSAALPALPSAVGPTEPGLERQVQRRLESHFRSALSQWREGHLDFVEIERQLQALAKQIRAPQSDKSLLQAQQQLSSLQAAVAQTREAFRRRRHADQSTAYWLEQNKRTQLANYRPRLERQLYQVAKAAGREVDLLLEGDEQWVDRSLLEALLPAIEHLLNNAVVHGIEPPRLRQMVGKGERGSVGIKVLEHNHYFELQVFDDGAGVDFNAVRRRAEALGLDASGNDQSLVPYLFLPGFSSMEHSTRFAGRGVGLDAVEEYVRGQDGQVHLKTTPGLGTRITIRCRLPMAKTAICLVGCAEARFAITADQVVQVIDAQKHSSSVRYQSKNYPVLDLAGQLGLPAGEASHFVLLQHFSLSFALRCNVIEPSREAWIYSDLPLMGLMAQYEAVAQSDGLAVPVLHVPGLAQTHVLAAPFESAGLLLVDSSTNSARQAMRLLQPIFGRVDWVRDAHHARASFAKNRYEHTLIDVDLSDADGFELLRVLARDHPKAQGHMSLMTIRDFAARSVEAQNQGLLLLRKPLDLVELEALASPSSQQTLL